MKVTIAVDDISLPLPPMATPDVRQTILEILLELLDANGVDDVHLIDRQLAAPPDDRGRDEADGGQRRSSTPSTRTATTTTTPRTPTASSTWARPSTNESVNINRRAVESDLLIYVNINLVPMDGGPQVGDGRAVRLREPARRTTSRRPSATPTATWIRRARRCNTKVERMGQIVDQHMNVFHIETALNNRMFDCADRLPGARTRTSSPSSIG